MAENCEPIDEKHICDVPCQRSADCAGLSENHRCSEGACRLGTDGRPPTEGGDECEGGGLASNELVLIGDSFFAVNHEITSFLEDKARSAGVLQAGENYRDYSRSTRTALAYLERGIQDQYETARDEAPVKVVIMNGGGADALVGDCDELDTSCPLIMDAALAFEELLETMAEDQVEHVVFVGYANPLVDAVRERLDLLRPLLEERCGGSRVPCHWVDMRPVFEGNYDEYTQPNGVNPTTAGSEASATAIWERMVEECIVQ